MKKYLSLFALCLIVLSCRKDITPQDDHSREKQKSSISLRQAIYMKNSFNLQSLSSPTVTTTNLLFGHTGTIQSTITDPNVIYRTHGQANWATSTTVNGDVYSLYLYTENYNSVATGSGVAVRYAFKQGKNYVIEMNVGVEGLELPGEPIDVKTRKPSFQLQLTNVAIAGVPSSAPVSLIAPGPVATVTTSSSSHSISFTPSECYEFLRFSALPNTTGISRGLIDFNSIKIIETNNVEIVGPTLEVNAQSTYSVSYSGLSIAEQFNWSVNGSYEIIGPSTGPTAVIKCNGTAGGSISIGLNGCQAIGIRTFADTSVPLPPIPPVLPGVTYFGKAVNGPRTYFFYGNGTSITAGVIIDPVKQFTVTHFIGAAITSTGNLTGRMYATDENGFAYTFVLSGMDFEPELL